MPFHEKIKRFFLRELSLFLQITQPPFLLIGLFVGIIDTVLLLIYNVIYRDSTGFSPADFINVSSLIFVENLVFVIIGAIYFLFVRSFRKGEIIYMILFLLLTIFLVWKTELVSRTADHLENVQFRGLLLGVVIVTGISAAFLVPYLYHSKKFEEYVI